LRIGEIAARAFVQQGDVRAGPYAVLRLSDCAALLAGKIPFGIGERCRVDLEVHGHAPQSADVEFVRADRFEGKDRSEMSFRNVSKEVRACLRKLLPPATGGERNSAEWQDRRRFPRARVAGNAIAFVGGRYVGAYVVRNLSAGGAHLVGDNNLAIGQVVQVLIRLGGQFSHGLDAEVVRREQLPSKEHSFAVAFRNLAPAVGDSLQNLALLTLADAVVEKEAAVLVLNSPSSVLLALDNDLRALGHDVVVVATPLDALSLLSSGTHRIVAVIAGCDLAHADPLGFLGFLKDAYPYVHRVALPGNSRPKQFDCAISTGVIQAVLNSPWNSDSLSESLRPSDSSAV
jgi:hypothetical protein